MLANSFVWSVVLYLILALSAYGAFPLHGDREENKRPSQSFETGK